MHKPLKSNYYGIVLTFHCKPHQLDQHQDKVRCVGRLGKAVADSLKPWWGIRKRFQENTYSHF